METILVKIFATALALSQVTTTPHMVKTQFDRVRDHVSGFSMIRNRLKVPYYDTKLGRLSNGPRNAAWEIECKLLWLKRKGTRGWKSRRS
jgi:hypothetical protein